MQMGSRDGEDKQEGSVWQNRRFHICIQVNQEEQLGNETDNATQGSSVGKWSLKTSDWKKMRGLRWREKLPTSQESSLEGPTAS